MNTSTLRELLDAHDENASRAYRHLRNIDGWERQRTTAEDYIATLEADGLTALREWKAAESALVEVCREIRSAWTHPS